MEILCYSLIAGGMNGRTWYGHNKNKGQHLLKKYEVQTPPEEVGTVTADVLKDHVPAELAGVVFLSGGQGVEQATLNLSEVIKNGPFPWPVTFSYARALQGPALDAWQGDPENIKKAQEAFFQRLIANTDALK